MTLIIHRTRSVRITIQPPEGQTIIVENLAFNEGYEVDFEVSRGMDESLGEATVRIYNLPASLRGALEAAQVRRPDDTDQILATLGLSAGWQVFGDVMSPTGTDALTVGFPLIRVEAGYDGSLSTLLDVVGARIVSSRESETTYVTEISGSDALDAVLYAKPTTVFEPGTPTYDVMTFLRLACGLGNGNVSQAQWSGIVGSSKLDAYYYSTTGGMDALKQLLDFLPLRWWIDGRDLYVIPKDGQPYPVGVPPPYVPDPPVTPDYLLAMPERVEGGFVEVRSLLTPAVLPGRLLLLSPAILGLDGATPEQIARVDVPPGIYRVESVRHSGSTAASGGFDTVAVCKRVLDA